MTNGRRQKLLIAAGLVVIVVLTFYVMRLNEQIDRQERRTSYTSEASQCENRCQASYTTARRRCSAHRYDGTRAWCRDQARTVRSSCMSRCPR